MLVNIHLLDIRFGLNLHYPFRRIFFYLARIILSALALSTFLFCTTAPSWPQGRLSEQPRLPFTDNGACPFEGCQYGLWTATKSIVALKDADANSPNAFTIRPGEKITALTGTVITRQFGIVRMLKPVSFDNVELPAGAVLYILHGEGEGYFLYWYNGATHSHDLYAETVHKGTDDLPWDVESVPVYEWWVQVKNRDGATGWLKNPAHFRGEDAFGGK